MTLDRLVEAMRILVFYEDVPSGYITRGIVHVERAERGDEVWWWVHGHRREEGPYTDSYKCLVPFSENKDTFLAAMNLVEEATKCTLPPLEDLPEEEHGDDAEAARAR